MEKKNIEKLKIFSIDVLQFNFHSHFNETAIEQKNDTSCYQKLIVGNLPYNISSPILFHLLQCADSITKQVLMLQKEVVDRLLAKTGSNTYSRLSVMMQSRYDIKHILDVQPSSFYPCPRVISSVIMMIPKKKYLKKNEYNVLERIVLKAFSHRRKMLRNNLDELKDQLNLTNQELKMRAQNISTDTYIQWAKLLTKIKDRTQN